ncbi:MAG: hypothetical protein NVSMB42_09970 [Herpetosiphon sp.]
MAWIKASELGEYAYCRRAWWLHHVLQEQPAGDARRHHGETLHARHSRMLGGSWALLLIGSMLLLAAFVILLS